MPGPSGLVSGGEGSASGPEAGASGPEDLASGPEGFYRLASGRQGLGFSDRSRRLSLS